jgi:hypothetical protein
MRTVNIALLQLRFESEGLAGHFAQFSSMVTQLPGELRWDVYCDFA